MATKNEKDNRTTEEHLDIEHPIHICPHIFGKGGVGKTYDAWLDRIDEASILSKEDREKLRSLEAKNLTPECEKCYNRVPEK